ncbi:hypothetical protein F4821DRAFT_257332 [Hypoxylon rubiginosum]|uniref:Uncharacterized protein n=1 Tax=Hypoxylon rubiginosum TaxID=110542 RepID=A0ACC0D9I5_9PEZI|nr:hypothetical protein F4821DRAFT_257332 [Hypoxylon rubiginosum]
MSPPPLRTACARCHAQKLRCPGRSENDPACSRCAKVGAVCVFGTSVRGKRPASVAAQGLRTASDMDKDFPAAKRVHRTLSTETSTQVSEQLTPPPINVEWSAGTGNAEVAEQIPLRVESPPAIISDTPTITDAHLQVVESLTQLNLDLVRHARTVPPLTGQPPDITKDYVPFKLDDTFKLTTTFLDVVRSLRLQESQDRHPLGWNVVVDTATLFLVMSCWHRLAGMYDCLFVLIKRCAEQSVLPATRGGRPVSLPLVTIGSFVPDATMSILLQMVATLQHSTQLANDMSDFAAMMSPGEGLAHGDEMSRTNVQRRTNNMHQQVRSIKSMLTQTGLL